MGELLADIGQVGSEGTELGVDIRLGEPKATGTALDLEGGREQGEWAAELPQVPLGLLDGDMECPGEGLGTR